MLKARDFELEFLNRCVAASRDESVRADNSREANLFQVAAMLIKSSFPDNAKLLLLASSIYFEINPNDRLSVDFIVKNCLISNLPRFRDGLVRKLNRG